MLSRLGVVSSNNLHEHQATRDISHTEQRLRSREGRAWRRSSKLHLDTRAAAAVVLRHQWFENVPATLFERSHRTGFVLLHEPAVADHVGCQNGGEAALGAFFGYVTPLPSENAE